MQVIVLFAVLALVLNAINIGICSFVEAYSPHASLLTFMGLFVVSFIIAWKVALYLTERFLLTDAQRAEMDHHIKVVRELTRG